VNHALKERRREQSETRAQAAGKDPAAAAKRSKAKDEGKLIQNLMAAIETRREIALDRFIFALGIRHVGETTARLLARNFATLKELVASMESEHALADLDAIGGIGETLAKEIVEFFGEPHNREVVMRLMEAVKTVPARARESRLAGVGQNHRVHGHAREGDAQRGEGARGVARCQGRGLGVGEDGPRRRGPAPARSSSRRRRSAFR
jgi:NAD-dependent DNA ligase